MFQDTFTDLLIQTCDIQEFTLNRDSYEATKEWTDKYSDVPCRKDSANNTNMQDGDVRVNIDDDLFFISKDYPEIEQGNRLVFDGDNYNVIKVNKLYDADSLHHLEVTARIADND